MRTRNVMLVVGGCFSLAFAVFQLSGIWWSGAQAIRRLPLLRAVLVGITAIYLLRGLLLLPEALAFHRAPTLLPLRFLLLSAIALAIGLVHLAGVMHLLRRVDAPHSA